MKTLVTATLLAVLAGTSAAFAVEPIEGSITYNGHQSYLEKSPAGSTLQHSFTSNGNDYNEVYKVNADRSVSLISRAVANNG